MSEDVSLDRLKSHVASLYFVRHLDSNPKGLEKARGYIWNQMMESGCYMLDQSWRSGKLVFHNVVGEKAAGFHIPPTLVVVAHYDTVDKSPGAGDNASGVAVMLEASRLIGSSGIPVRVFFAAVSMKELWQGSSLRGSERLVANMKSRGIPVSAAICLDSVGVAGQMKQSTPEGLTVALPAEGDFLAVVGCESDKGPGRYLLRFQQGVRRQPLHFPCHLARQGRNLPRRTQGGSSYVLGQRIPGTVAD